MVTVEDEVIQSTGGQRPQGELLADPDVSSIPGGAHHGARGPSRAEARHPRTPGRIIVVGGVPCRGSHVGVGGVLPRPPRVLGCRENVRHSHLAGDCLLIGGEDLVQGGLEHTVVGEKTVALILDIGDLRIDSGIEAAAGFGVDEVNREAVVDGGDVIGGIGTHVVAARQGWIPQVPGHLETDAAIFPVHWRLGRAGGIARRGVAVVIEHIPYPVVVSPAGLVDQARRVKSVDQLHQRSRGCLSDTARGVLLPLSLIEDVPHDDGRAVDMGQHHAAQLGLELRRVHRRGRGIARVGIAARHVLPNQHSQRVRPIIPAVPLHLNVLADHVKPEVLRLLDVELERVISWGSVSAVRPEALVQWPHLEQDLVIQQHLLDAIDRAYRDLAHAEIAADRVVGDAALDHGDLQSIEIRIVRRPELGAGNGQAQLAKRAASQMGHHHGAVQDRG